jgi:hypothetical protein
MTMVVVGALPVTMLLGTSRADSSERSSASHSPAEYAAQTVALSCMTGRMNTRNAASAQRDLRGMIIRGWKSECDMPSLTAPADTAMCRNVK